MELYVFDFNFNLLGDIDEWETLIFDKNYDKAHTLDLAVEPTDKNLELLRGERIIARGDNLKEAYCFNFLNLKDEDKELMNRKGESLISILNRRIVWGQQSKKGTTEEVIKFFVEQNAINPSDLRRIIPNLIITPNRGLPGTHDAQCSYLFLNEFAWELANKNDCSIDLAFDYQNKKFVFDVWQGRDLSVNQSINQKVIFSPEFDNVIGQNYTEISKDFKNTLLIGGQGEGFDRKTATIGNDLTGFNRFETFVDARDISDIKGKDSSNNDIPYSNEEYNNLLIERGKSKQVDMQVIRTFESDVDYLSNFIYKKDYDLGDKVTIANDRWGITMDTRITRVQEVYKDDKPTIKIGFGSNIPTLIDKIKQKMR